MLEVVAEPPTARLRINDREYATGSPYRIRLAAPGHLRVGATPWCNVSVDGRAYGQTPLVNITLPPGSHRVTCTSPEAPTRTRSVTLAPGQNLPVVFGAQ